MLYIMDYLQVLYIMDYVLIKQIIQISQYLSPNDTSQ